MIIEDIVTYQDYMRCLDRFDNGDCFREEFSNDTGLVIALEQTKLTNNKNFKMLTVYYGADALAVPLNNKSNYKEVVQDVSKFVRRKRSAIE